MAKKKPSLYKNVSAISEEMRRLIIQMTYESKSGESGPALCITDIIAVLYFRILHLDPDKPEHPNRDRFILSKGHAGPALYTALALRGFFPNTHLKKYRIDDGILHLHPCSSTVPGIEVSTGSLGHGLSIGAGIALSLKTQHPKRKVFVLMGDGECNEGSVWEAAMFASNHKLNNLVAIIDQNKFQGFGETKEVMKMDLAKKWSAFGWKVFVVDGHDTKELEKVMITAKESNSPTVILANTINGKGIPKIENTLLAHYFITDEATYLESRKKHAK